MKWLASILLAAAVSASAANFYVSPTGSSTNTGTSTNSPWSARHSQTNKTVVAPGDTIWWMAGNYDTHSTSIWYSANCTLVGTENAFITNRPLVDNYSVTIDPGLYHVSGDYVEFNGLIVTCSAARTNDYVGRPAGLVGGGHDRAINCIVDDTGHPGISGSWSEVYGNICWGVGIFEYDNVTHFLTNVFVRGSALYLQNYSTNRALVQHNISRGNLNAGMKAYAESGQVQNFIFDGNVSLLNNGEGIEYECLDNSISNAIVWNNNTYRNLKNPMGYFPDRAGLSLAHHGSLTYSNNYDYGSPGAGTAVLWMMRWSNIVCLNNTIIATSRTNEWLPGSGVGLGLAGKFVDIESITNVATSYLINSNSYYGGREQASPFYDSGGIFQGKYTPFYVVQAMPYDGTNGQMDFVHWQSSWGYDTNGSSSTNLPTSNRIVVQPNKYVPGRAQVIVWNWESNSTATVNLSSIGLSNGQRYEIRDVQNYFGTPVLTTNYSAASPSIAIPLTGTNVTAIAGEGFAEAFTFNPNIHTASLFNVFLILPVTTTSNYLNSATFTSLTVGTP